MAFGCPMESVWFPRSPGWRWRPSLLRLAVVVLERLDPADHAQAAPVDLAGARIPAHVVGPAGAVDQHGQAIGAGLKCVGDAGPGRPRDHVAGAQGDVFASLAGRLSARRWPELA